MKRLLAIVALVPTFVFAEPRIIATTQDGMDEYSLLEESIVEVPRADGYRAVVSFYDKRNQLTRRWPVLVTGCTNQGGEYINQKTGTKDYWTWVKNNGVILDMIATEICVSGAVKGYMEAVQKGMRTGK